MFFSQCLKRTYPSFDTITQYAAGSHVEINNFPKNYLFAKDTDAISRGGSRTTATSKVELFLIIVNGWKPLTIITKSSTLDVAAVLDPPLISNDIIKVITIFISSITYSTQINFQLIRNLNSLLYNTCIKYGFKFVDNGAVSKSHLWKGGIHLLGSGKAIIANNFINNVNFFLGKTNLPIRNF